MQNTLGLHELNAGDCAIVYEVRNEPVMRRRLQDLGLVENTKVECIGKAPGGELCAYLIRGAVIAIRALDGKKVRVFPMKGEHVTYHGAE